MCVRMAQQEKRSLVKELVELGKQKGSLTNQDILDAIGEADMDPEKLEKLYDAIESQGIEIIEDMVDIKIEDIEIPYEESKDDDSSAPVSDTGLSIDDPVKPNPIFNVLQELGNIDDQEIYQTFNMGMGFTIIAPADEAKLTSVLLSALPSATSAEECSSSI